MTVAEKIKEYTAKELAHLFVKILDENGVSVDDYPGLEEAYESWLTSDLEE